MSITITKADVSHAAAIATIGKRSFRHAFERLFSSREELFEYLEHTYDPVKLARSLRKENNCYLLAWYKNEPVGFTKIKKDSLNEHIESVSQIELQKIYVLPDRQGLGAGHALVHAVLDMANELMPDYTWLDTHVSNERAISLYERHGFEKIGKHYFTIGTQTFEYHVMARPNGNEEANMKSNSGAMMEPCCDD